MSARKKYGWQDLLHYLQGKGSSTERHELERQLEADPFEQEALEGLERIGAKEAEEDVLALHDRLRKRLSRRRRRGWIAAAASVASLLILGTLFLQIYDISGTREEDLVEDMPHILQEGEKETPRATPQETARAAPEETPRETPRATPQEAPQEDFQATPQEAPRAAPQEALQAAPQETARAAPQETPRAAPEDAAPDVPASEPSPKAVTESAPREGFPQEALQEAPGATPQEALQAAPQETARAAPEDAAPNVPASEPSPKAVTESAPREGFPQEVRMDEEEPAISEDLVVHEAEAQAEAAPLAAPSEVSKRKSRPSIKPETENITYIRGQAISNQELSTLVSGKVISADDMEPVPGATITIRGVKSGTVSDLEGNFALDVGQEDEATLVASFIGMESQEKEVQGGQEVEFVLEPNQMTLNEVVVVSTGSTESRPSELEHDSAEPLGGFQAFRRYIKKEIRHPEAGQETKQIVVLRFQVEPDGSLTHMEVLRSPGEAFSREAIRLLNEGPDWEAARGEMGPYPSTVRIRITFK